MESWHGCQVDGGGVGRSRARVGGQGQHVGWEHFDGEGDEKEGDDKDDDEDGDDDDKDKDDVVDHPTQLICIWIFIC